MKKIVLIIGVLMLLFLTGCGTKFKSEEEILQDIVFEDEIFQAYGNLEVKTFLITERKSDSENKSDDISFILKANNEDFVYEITGEIYYCLYDQGWVVDNVSRNEKKITPLRSNVTLEMADNIAESFLDQRDSWSFLFESRNTELERGEDIFHYVIEDSSSKYWVNEYDMFIKYIFDEEKGWIYEDFELQQKGGYWNEETLCGTWRTERAGLKGYFEITIYDVEDESGIVSAYYECDVTGIGLTKPLKESGYGKFDFSVENSYVVHSGMFESFVIKLNKTEGVVFGGYYCEKTKDINPQRVPDVLSPVCELENRENRKYDELLTTIANVQSESELYDIVFSDDFNTMCEEYLDTLTEDCVIYNNGNEFIALHHIIVPEGQIKPYYGYMLFYYNEETFEGMLFGKSIGASDESPSFYCVTGSWGESQWLCGNKEKVINGYYPVSVVKQYMVLPTGVISELEGMAPTGIWENLIFEKLYNETGLYFESTQLFCEGYYVDKLEGDCCLQYIYTDENGEKTTGTNKNLFFYQEDALGIMGFGDVTF